MADEYSRDIDLIRGANTLDDIQGVALKYSARAAGEGGVLYSRPVGSVSSEVIAKELARVTGEPIINDTPRAKFMGNAKVEAAIHDAAERIFLQQGNSFAEAEALASDFLYGNPKAAAKSPTSLEGSLWGRASSEFVGSLRGDIKVIATNANMERVFGKVELPVAIDSESIRTLGGRPIAELRDLYARGGAGSVLPQVQAQFIEAAPKGIFVSVEGVGDNVSMVKMSREVAASLGADAAKFTPAAELVAAGLRRAPIGLAAPLPSSIDAVATGAAFSPENISGRAPGMKVSGDVAASASAAEAARITSAAELETDGLFQAPGESSLSSGGSVLNTKSTPQRGFATMEMLMGEVPSATALRATGLVATGIDAVATARRTAELLEQGNEGGARSEVSHAIARNGGAWLGGAGTAAVVGSSGFLPASAVMADALLMSKAFEKGADHLDDRRIFRQADANGVEWAFNGTNWEREGLVDRTQDRANSPASWSVGASYDKARELGARANAAAVDLALAKAPKPEDPFDIPARRGDRIGLDNQNWRRDPETQQWQRQVKSSVHGANDSGTYETQIAPDARSLELNREAISRIQRNVETGREAIAATYMEHSALQRSKDFVDTPASVEQALPRSGVVLSHDNKRFQQDESGRWVHGAEVANGNLALELELTQQLRQPSIDEFHRNLAEIGSRPPPSPAEQERNELLHCYRSSGVNLEQQPEWQQAIGIAVERRSKEDGISGPFMQQLRRGDAGMYGGDSPIELFKAGADGVARPVGIVTSEELRQAWNEVRGARAVPLVAGGQAADSSTPTLAPVSAVLPTRQEGQKDDGSRPERVMDRPLLANDPAHPDFANYDRIHQWTRGTGHWNDEQSSNVAAALYKQQLDDPLLRRVDKVSGALGRNGEENVFAIYAPYGDKGPFFHAQVDGRQAAQQPAQQNLEQAEQVRQQQLQGQPERGQDLAQQHAQAGHAR